MQQETKTVTFCILAYGSMRRYRKKIYSSRSGKNKVSSEQTRTPGEKLPKIDC